MAQKFWYKAANGSDNWAVAGNWYNGSGGTGGLAGVPTAIDDVIIDAASGSGTITIAAAATCLSINFTGFTGTLAGTSTLAFLGDITLSSSMTLTYSGTATLGNGLSVFTSNGKTVTFNITVNNAGAVFYVNTNLTMSSTNTLTLNSGNITNLNPNSDISVGFFVSTGSATRIIDNNIYLTGAGTVWNVSGTNFGNNNINAYITNASSSAKTISNTATTAPSGYAFRLNFYITGAGTGSYTLTGNFEELVFSNTGGASFSFGTSNLANNFDFGYYNPTCNMVWNNGATVFTHNTDSGGSIYIGQNVTIIASPSLAYTNPSANASGMYNPYNKSLTSAITINSPGGLNLNEGSLRTTSTITLTLGTLNAGDVYCSSISSSNANTRDININNLYLTGTGTLATFTTTTNLTVNIADIYVTNSSATAKSLTLNSVFYPNGGGVYLAGSGSGQITLAAGTSALFPIYVTNTGGANISFSTATIKSLEFSVGTNAVWGNGTGQILTITDALSIAPSAGNPTNTPALIFTGNNSYVVYIYLNGKSLVSGTCTLNDSSYSANQINYYFDGFSSNAAFTVTSAYIITFDGAFSGPSYTSTSAAASTFNSSLTLTGALSLANNPSYGNTVQVYGNFSAATVSHLATGTIELQGTTSNVTTSITLNNATSLAYFYHSGTLTTLTFSITNGYLDSLGNLNCATLTIGNGFANFFNNVITLTGIFTLTAGALYSLNSTFSSTTFVCSATANSRDISLNNSSWALTGTGTVWNLVDGGTLTANLQDADIYITNTSVTAVTFAGAGQGYRYLFIRRGAINTNQVILTGSNSFLGLYHTGGSTQTLTFPAGIDTYIYDTFAVGSSSAVTNISSSSSSVPFNIIKFRPGLVICNNVSITRSAATPTNTWYAINSTNVAGNTGWVFGPPSRRLSSLGTG